MNLLKRLRRLWQLSAEGRIYTKESDFIDVSDVMVPGEMAKVRPRKMAEIIKRNKVDPIEEITNERDNPIL